MNKQVVKNIFVSIFIGFFIVSLLDLSLLAAEPQHSDCECCVSGECSCHSGSVKACPLQNHEYASTDTTHHQQGDEQFAFRSLDCGSGQRGMMTHPIGRDFYLSGSAAYVMPVTSEFVQSTTISSKTPLFGYRLYRPPRVSLTLSA